MSDRARPTPTQERRKARLLAQGARYQERLAANAGRKEALYEQRRRLFLELEACGAKLAEIAEAFGINESAVSQQLRRAREKVAAETPAATG